MNIRTAGGLRCPHCQNGGSGVIESRTMDAGNYIRRRRQCDACRTRWTTFETTIPPSLRARAKQIAASLRAVAQWLEDLEAL